MYDKEETAWTRELCAAQKRYRVDIRPQIAGPGVPKGWEDRLIVARFQIFLVEFKGPLTELLPSQITKLKHHHANCPGSTFIARRITGSKGGIIQHPVTYKLLTGFKDFQQFLPSLYKAKSIILESYRNHYGKTIQEMEEEYLRVFLDGFPKG